MLCGAYDHLHVGDARVDLRFAAHDDEVMIEYEVLAGRLDDDVVELPRSDDFTGAGLGG